MHSGSGRIIQPLAFIHLPTLVLADDFISLLHRQRRGGVSISAFNRDVKAVRNTRGRRDRVTTRSFSGTGQGVAADAKSKRSQSHEADASIIQIGVFDPNALSSGAVRLTIMYMEPDFRGRAKSKTHREQRRPTVVRSTSELIGRRGSCQKIIPVRKRVRIWSENDLHGRSAISPVSISLHKVVAEIISIMSLCASNTLAACSSMALGEF